MRLATFAVPLFCALLLSACTAEGWEHMKSSFHGEFRTTEEGPPAPPPAHPPGEIAYYSRTGAVLKPPGAIVDYNPAAPPPVASVSGSGLTWRPVASFAPEPAAAASAPTDSGGLVWHPVDSFTPAARAAAPAPSEGRRYNGSVEVFSLDGAETFSPPPPSGDDAWAPVVSYPAQTAAFHDGGPAKKIFFAHGSDVIGGKDKKGLKTLAGGIRKDNASVTIVGHASTRVDGVSDPVRRKMINLEMAQKRADSVTRELRKSGVAPGWVQAVSEGEEHPNPDPGAMSQEAADRRAEVFVNR